MRVAVVLDKSGTVVKAYRVLCDLKTGRCFACESTLRFVAENAEALVNITGPISGILSGDRQRLGLKISCAPEGWCEEIGKSVLEQQGVMESLGRAIRKVEADSAKELGICAALLVAPGGKATHAVALGGEIYSDVPGALAEIRAAGDDVFLATGNCKESSLRCARLLGIPRQFVLYDASPKEKRDLVRRLKSYYGAVIMVGNDINDIDAMGEAEVGILLRRGDSPSVNGLDERGEIDFILDSMDGVKEVSRRVKEPLSRSTGLGTLGACAGGRRRSRPPGP